MEQMRASARCSHPIPPERGSNLGFLAPRKAYNENRGHDQTDQCRAHIYGVEERALVMGLVGGESPKPRIDRDRAGLVSD